MPNQIRVRASVKDDASKQIGGIRGLLQGLGKDAKSSILTGVGIGAGISAFNLFGGAVRGLIGSFGQAFTALMRVERINAQTAQTIKSTGGAAGVTAEHVEGLAGSIEKLTGIEAESVQEGANLLLTFTNIRNQVGEGNDIFDQATQAITDMGVALGQDARSSAIQLGKALQDPIAGVTALRKVGVSFTDQQREQIKVLVESGRTLDAQKIILHELAVEFGGAAEAFGETTAGQIARLGHEVGALQEELLEALLPALKEIVIWLRTEVVPVFGDFVQWLGDTGDAATQFSIDLHRATGGLLGMSEAAAADIEQTDQLLDNLRNLPPALREVLIDGAEAVRSGSRQFISGIYTETDAARRKAIAAVRALPGDLAKALKQGQDDVESGMAALTEAMEESLSDAAKITYLQGVLTSQELAAGLRDERADVRAAAMQVRDDALEQLNLLQSGAADAAVNAGTTFAEQLRLQRVAAGNAAAEIMRGVRGNLEFANVADDWGRTSIQAWINGMRSKWGAAHTAAIYLGTAVSGPLKGYSPPREGPLKDIGKWGENVGKTWAEGLGKGTGLDLNLPSLAGGTSPAPALAGGGGGLTINFNSVWPPTEQQAREVAEIVDRNLYYMGGGTALLPRN